MPGKNNEKIQQLGHFFGLRVYRIVKNMNNLKLHG